MRLSHRSTGPITDPFSLKLQAPVRMRPIWLTVLRPSLGNVFMTFAWYAHLKELSQKP